MTGANDLDLETDEAWEDLEAALLTVDEEGEAEKWRREQAELRRMLGVDDAFGYRIVDDDDDDDDDGGAGAPGYRAADGAPAPRVRATPEISVRRAPGGNRDGRAAAARFPYMEGVRYSGCLGMICALDTCWTGGATVSFAHRMREQAHVSTALYLPGAPCHGCACLREDDAPVASLRSTGRPRVAPSRAHEEEQGAGDGGKQAADWEAPEEATLRRITCARGLWAHPISLASFVTGRIPMCDADEPESCPGFEPRPAPHPAVAAHLRKRRERAKRQREERRPGAGYMLPG